MVRVPIGGVGAVGRLGVHDEKPVGISASVLKRSLSAGSAVVRNAPFQSSSSSNLFTSTLQPHPPTIPLTSVPVSSGSSSSFGSGRTLLSSSDILYRLCRSTSAAGVVLRRSLIQKRSGLLQPALSSVPAGASHCMYIAKAPGGRYLDLKPWL
jgi:hypothetical protein